jgi:hypothetical protein
LSGVVGKAGSEPVLGDVPVVAQLAMGSERLRLFFTGSRILVVHVGKRGAAALAGTTFFGWLSGAVEDIFKRGKESVTKTGLEALTPDQILATDRENFDIKYTDVVEAELVEEEFYSVIRLLTVREKLEFRTGKSFEYVASLMGEFLADRMVVHRAPPTESRVGHR